MKKIVAMVGAIVMALALGACHRSAADRQARTGRHQLGTFLTNQPVPVFTYSQLRQNLIELQTAQAQTTQTTTFFFNMGVAQPIQSCPSIGFPIPTTTQLTDPAQIESTGTFTGSSSGTYVICVDAQGHPYADYWEGFVQTVTGPARWNNGQVELMGPPSFNFTKGKK